MSIAANLLWIFVGLLGAGIVFLATNRGWELPVIVALVAVIFALSVAQLFLSRGHEGRTRKTLEEINLTLNRFAQSTTFIDWSYDAVDHRLEFYRKITELIEDERTYGYHVLTILQYSAVHKGMDIPTREAISKYYATLEKALQDRDGFRYRRAIVVRRPIREQDNDIAGDICSLLKQVQLERPEFGDHYRAVRKQARKSFLSESQMKFYVDDGQFLDLAFAITTDRNGHALALVIELSIATSLHTDRQTSETGIPRTLGLLIIRNPDERLQKVFQLAHTELFDGHILDQIPEDLVFRTFTN